jgi:two-component system chemotaxis response regulator CheB
LTCVLGSFPKDFPAAVVVVQHRAELPGSAWQNMVQRMTTSHVNITAEGHLKLTDGVRIRGVLSSANPLFETAAENLGIRTIAVVLTGWGRDATDGVQAVRRTGGVVIAQDEQSCVDFGMPGSAIATGSVDYVRSVEDIGPLVVDLVQQHRVSA